MRLLSLLLILGSGSAVWGAVESGWTRSGGSYDYTDPSNWVDGQINDLFSSALTVDHTLFLRFTENYTAQNGITFEGTLDNLIDSGSEFSLQVYLGPSRDGTLLSLGGDIRIHPKEVTGHSMPQFILKDIYPLRVDLGGADRTFHLEDVVFWTSGGVQGQGGITKTGSGTLRLLGENTFTGGVDLREGTLDIESADGLGGGPLRLGHGTYLRADNSSSPSITNEVFINGDVRIGGYGQPIFAGSIHLGASTRTITVEDDAGYHAEFAGPVSGAPGVGLIVSKEGNGHLILSGANTYDGGTKVLSGSALALAHKDALGTGPLHLANEAGISTPSNTDLTGANAVRNPVYIEGESVTFGHWATGASSRMEFTGPIYLAGGSQTFATQGQSTTFSGPIVGVAGSSIIVDRASDNQAGSLVLRGINTIDGGITLRSVLTISDPRSLGTGPLTIEGGHLRIMTAMTEANAITNVIRLRGSATISDSMPIQLNGPLDVDIAGASLNVGFADLTLSGPLTGSGGSLRLFNLGYVRVNAASSFSGDTVLAGKGRYRLGSNTALGTGKIIVEGAVLLEFGAPFLGEKAIKNDLELKSDFAIGGSRDVEFSGTTNLGATTRKITVSGSGLSILSGEVQNSASVAGLTKAGGGSLVLTNVNTYTGPTRVEGGMLIVRGNVPRGAPGPLGNATTPVALRGGGGLVVEGSFSVDRDILVENDVSGTQVIGGRSTAKSSFNGSLVLNGSTAVTSIGGGEVELNGHISGDRSLRISGAGTVVLSNSNDYTGATRVSDGTLEIANTSGSATGTGSVSVMKGILTGTGAVSGPVTIGDGVGVEDSVVAPGDGVGVLSTGSISLDRDAVFRFEFHSQSDADLLRSAGPITLSDPKLVMLSLAPEALPLGSFVLLMENLGIAGTTGQFFNLPQGADIQFGANFFRLDYRAVAGSDGLGNDVVAYVVPEPTVGIALIASLLGGRRLWRKRKRLIALSGS